MPVPHHPIGKVDFVFLSGDIANKGKSEEYEEFIDSFLLPLILALGDDWNGGIFSIPGNHDVQRDKSKFFNPQGVLRTSDHLFDPTEQGMEQRGQFVTRFENYIRSELTNSPSKWIASNEGAFSHMSTIFEFPRNSSSALGSGLRRKGQQSSALSRPSR